jgi:hypothetical protein
MRDREQCVCGETYDGFRTGLDFAEVKRMMWVDSDDPSTWRYRTRRMVLGFWHALKGMMFALHCQQCEHYSKQEENEA